MEVVLEVSGSELRGSTAITGFRGFGMVGYLVSKHLALSMRAEKVGTILADSMPPVILVEEDGVGYPYDVYYSRERRALIVVNRSVPGTDAQDEYARFLSSWFRGLGVSRVILVGGLAREFRPEGEEHGYRWIRNKYYEGPLPRAPTMEYGLGVMGPLSLLYMHLERYKIPTIMILPYTVVEGVEFNSILLGVRVIAEELLSAKLDLKYLEGLVKAQKVEMEKVLSMVERRETGGIFM